MSVDWLTKLGKKGFESLLGSIVDEAVNKAIDRRVDPRFHAIETRLAAIEQRLDVADRLAKVEAELTVLKQRA